MAAYKAIYMHLLFWINYWILLSLTALVSTEPAQNWAINKYLSHYIRVKWSILYNKYLFSKFSFNQETDTYQLLGLQLLAEWITVLPASGKWGHVAWFKRKRPVNFNAVKDIPHSRLTYQVCLHETCVINYHITDRNNPENHILSEVTSVLPT